MANYSVRIFKRSGYNVINTPDTPERLAADSIPEDLPSVNILQNRRLSSILVACTNESAQDADYIKIGNMYYAIADFAMQSVSTCLFSIVEKPLLSVGGVKAVAGGASARFEILDGVTSRCTVKDDSWGAYTSDDPLTAPQEPLVLQTEWLSPSGGTTAPTISGDPILIESTVDLSSQAFNQTGDTYTDDETGETVTVPKTVPIKTKEADHTTSFSIDGAKKSNGTEIFCRNDSGKAGGSASEAGVIVDKGVSVVRQLGIESGSIISQYRLPKEFCGGITVTYPFATGADGADTGQRITLISGVNGRMSSGISPDYAPVKNKRVLYGNYNKYGLITCSGNSAEFNPEDLGGETAPSISYKSDPRPKGKPYYRFTTINRDSDFWRNCLPGSTWENVPLIYQGASGSALTRLNFDNERSIKSLEKQQYDETYDLRQAQNLAGVADGIVSSISGGMAVESATTKKGLEKAMGQMNSGNSGIFSSLVNMGATKVASHQYNQMYAAEKANELSGLYQSTNVYAPTVNFPYDADILRDVKGNGVLVYKYHMSANDTKRVDKLLTMYGYKSAEPLTLENFQRRKYFDYVACSTVSVTGDYPRWLLDDIADELKNGIRIWHTKPNSSAYNDNPVRS